jgi:hypothetical protein
MTIGSLGETEFDYFLPFKVDLGQAAVIADWLREHGHPACTADVVAAELARPDADRTIVGRFASAHLYRAGWRP